MVASLGYREQAPRFLEIGLVEPQVNSRCDQENAVIVRGGRGGRGMMSQGGLVERHCLGILAAGSIAVGRFFYGVNSRC